ncbi:MAG: fibronectin type III domain-containing protein [Salinispira sp.]
MKIMSYRRVTLFTFCSIFIVLMAGCPMPDMPPTMFVPALVAGDEQLTASWVELAAIWNEVNKKDGKNTITAYNLRYGEFGSESWTEINTGITGTSHTITELTNGLSYAVQVRAGRWAMVGICRCNSPCPCHRS